MRILHVSAYKEGSGGGGGKITWEIAHECIKIGIESKMLAPQVDSANFTSSLTDSGLEVINYPSDVVLDFMNFFKFSLKNVKKLYEFLDDFKPDIIHFHTPVPFILLLELWAIKNSKKVVHTIHENPHKLLSYGLFKEGSFIDKLTKKIGVDNYLLTVYEGVDQMVSVNNLHNKAIRDFGYTGRLTTVFNGRNLKVFNILKTQPINSTVKLFFTGLICQRKNQLFLASVMEHLPKNVELYLLGGILDKEYLKEINGYRNVHILGEIPFDKLPKVIEGFDIFVSASLEEAFSLAVIEALAAGKPVVALENDTTNLLINNLNGRYLDKSASVKQFASSVMNIINLPTDEYLSMTSEARKSVSMYDWSKVIQEYKSIYLDLIDSNTSNPQANIKRYKLITKLLNNFIPENTVTNLIDRTLRENSLMKKRSTIIISSIVILLITTLLKWFKSNKRS